MLFGIEATAQARPLSMQPWWIADATRLPPSPGGVTRGGRRGGSPGLPRVEAQWRHQQAGSLKTPAPPMTKSMLIP